ncbi:MAG: aspartate ammonia-lyase, partial [Clostridia bacterium]|nr:aspartate ammonia-lyase [Clostridia bacterium]
MSKRTESDSIGALEIPQAAYYGVQTLRGFQNFQITGGRVSLAFIRNIVKIKKAAAFVNGRYGYIDGGTAAAIISACDEALDGKFDADFITDPIQGGAGTSVNMNVNEVIANRAT